MAEKTTTVTETAKRGRKADGKVAIRARISEDAQAKLEDYRWTGRFESVADVYAKAIEDFAAKL